MNLLKVTLIVLCSALMMGCYAGSQFTIEASHLDHPVSMTSAIHNADLQVLTPAEYDERGRFSVTFAGWSVGPPVSPNPTKDISDVLNDVVKERGGNGITQLSIHAANNPINFVSAFFRGMSLLGAIGGVAALSGKDANIAETGGVIALSVACFIFLPAIGDFTVEGMVVRIKEKPPK